MFYFSSQSPYFQTLSFIFQSCWLETEETHVLSEKLFSHFLDQNDLFFLRAISHWASNDSVARDGLVAWSLLPRMDVGSHAPLGTLGCFPGFGSLWMIIPCNFIYSSKFLQKDKEDNLEGCVYLEFIRKELQSLPSSCLYMELGNYFP